MANGMGGGMGGGGMGGGGEAAASSAGDKLEKLRDQRDEKLEKLAATGDKLAGAFKGFGGKMGGAPTCLPSFHPLGSPQFSTPRPRHAPAISSPQLEVRSQWPSCPVPSPDDLLLLLSHTAVLRVCLLSH